MDDDSFYIIFRDAIRSYRGKRLAQKEVYNLVNKTATFEEITNRRPSFFQTEENVRNPRHEFILAWRRIYLDLGASDAYHARWRNDIFQSIHYENGWLDQAVAMRERGFSHKANDAVLDLFIADRNRRLGIKG